MAALALVGMSAGVLMESALDAAPRMAAGARRPAARTTPVRVSTTPASPSAMVFATGALPIERAAYDGLPKLPQFRAFLPKRVDLSAQFPEPGNQGVQPNCVAWATTYAAQSFLVVDREGVPSARGAPMSPAYVYNRLRDPGSACNRAVRIVDALNLLQREGTVTLGDFPDDLATCTTPAPQALLGKAAQYRLSGWRAVDRETPGDWRTPVVVDDIKGAVARGDPVVFAMPAVDDFMALRDGTVYRHAVREDRNWHAMAVVGYDEDRQAFRVINSWGRQWGDGGYAWIDYATFKLLAAEAYALQGLTPAPQPEPQSQPEPQPQPVPAPTPPPAPPPVDYRALLDGELARIGCGAVTATTAADGTLQLAGFGGDAEALARIRSAAEKADPAARWHVAHNPWPQCEAQLTLADALALGGVTLVANKLDGASRSGDPVTMAEGELFGLTASVPAGRPHLSIVYLQADGSAVELYRGVPDKGSVAIGLSGTAADRFQVGQPLGDEMVIALASDRPMFGPEMGDYATERQFLTGLRARLAAATPGSVSAAVLRIRTEK